MFARIAGSYDFLNHTLSAGIDRRWRRRVVERAGQAEGAVVIDSCCGTGDLGIEFARRGAKVIGVDFTPEMLEHALPKQRALATPTLFAHGHGLALPARVAERDGGRGLRRLRLRTPDAWYRLSALGDAAGREAGMSPAQAWDEDWDDEEAGTEAGAEHQGQFDWAPAHKLGNPSHRSLALGLLAMVPLFLAYELGLASDDGLARSQSEQALFRILSLLPDAEVTLRRLILAGAAVAALVVCYKRRLALLPSLMRIAIEGFFGALAMGPALAYGMRLFGGFDNEVAPLTADTSLPVAARVFGAAAFEELLFRVAIYGVLFVLARRVALFFGVAERASAWAAEVVAVLGSSLGFAAIHLSVCTTWLGSSGESFDAAIFTWRFLAGVLLALLFRWRGPGVAAWSHALFNLALLIGAGPEILL